MEVSFCQTISFNADTFEYDVVSQDNGNATVIKFPIDEKQLQPRRCRRRFAGRGHRFSRHHRQDRKRRSLRFRPERFAFCGDRSVNSEDLFIPNKQRVLQLNQHSLYIEQF